MDLNTQKNEIKALSQHIFKNQLKMDEKKTSM